MVRILPGRRWAAVAASVVVSAAMFYAQDKQTPTPAAGSATTPDGHVVPAVPGPPVIGSPDRGTVSVATETQARLLAASAPVPAPDFRFPLAAGKAPEDGLQIHTVWLARAISVMFLDIQTIGGYRQDPLPWHPNGLAIDVMIPNHRTPEGIELGNQIAGYALANAKRWGVLHVIWRQGFYPGVGAPSWTADYGHETANHFDHVHIATDGGGYPTGNETYYFDSMTP